jgi:hypothetical protein
VNVKVILSLIAGLVVYPNPITDKLAIEINHPAFRGNIYVALTNALGQVVMEKNLLPVSSATETTFETIHLSLGVYFLMVESGQERAVVRVVK